MKRVPENNGVYVECPVNSLGDRHKEMLCAHIIVLTDARIELAGDEKTRVLKKFEHCFCKLFQENPELDSEQLSRMAMREVLLAGC